MTTSTKSEPILTSAPQRIPLLECRPSFEAALSRINERRIESNAENVKKPISDSFGAWFEWD
jgi:hypothetical protein